MDLEALLVGAVGGIFGALGTGGFTSWRDYRRERRHLSGAMGMVAVELEENRDRIESGINVDDRLTLHDWAQNKATLAEHLEPLNPTLWQGLVHAYSTIHEARGQAGAAPSVEQLSGLKQQLDAERLRLKPRFHVRRALRRSPSG